MIGSARGSNALEQPKRPPISDARLQALIVRVQNTGSSGAHTEALPSVLDGIRGMAKGDGTPAPP